MFGGEWFELDSQDLIEAVKFLDFEELVKKQKCIRALLKFRRVTCAYMRIENDKIGNGRGILKEGIESLAADEKNILLSISNGYKTVRQLAEEYGVGGGAIKTRYKKIIFKLRARLKVGQFAIFVSKSRRVLREKKELKRLKRLSELKSGRKTKVKFYKKHLCKCGCGTPIPDYRDFVFGHNK